MNPTVDQIIEKWNNDPEIVVEVLAGHGYDWESRALEARLHNEQIPAMELGRLSSWNFVSGVRARSTEPNEWTIVTDTKETWRARRWNRRATDSSPKWEQGTLTDYVQRVRSAVGFKRDQYDYITVEAIRQWGWDPVEIWPKGRYHQDHDLAGITNGRHIIISSQNCLWCCELDKKGHWSIDSTTPTVKYRKLSIEITKRIGL